MERGGDNGLISEEERRNFNPSTLFLFESHKATCKMDNDVLTYNQSQTDVSGEICHALAKLIDEHLAGAESKIWHAHPVWFLDGNPIVGYSKLKAGVRLMFWSGASFEEDKLTSGTGKFKDASVLYTAVEEINAPDVIRWLDKATKIQWDYKNLVKRKGKLERLK